jgi:hypothetical protein
METEETIEKIILMVGTKKNKSIKELNEWLSVHWPNCKAFGSKRDEKGCILANRDHDKFAMHKFTSNWAAWDALIKGFNPTKHIQPSGLFKGHDMSLPDKEFRNLFMDLISILQKGDEILDWLGVYTTEQGIEHLRKALRKK